MQREERFGQTMNEMGLNPPPGVHFVAKDSELIENYLKPMNENNPLPFENLGQNFQIPIWDISCSPDQLPRDYLRGKHGELFFYVERDLQKPRVPRKAGNGIWRATGFIEKIEYGGKQIGTKRAFAFINEDKKNTGWIMDEYTVEGEDVTNSGAKRTKKREFVLCKIYQKQKRAESCTT